ncbi:MAG: OmpA family protein [Saprospiraceae bacterium]|nr:OmpA family protein [Saprospiraceae bacterium]MDW8485007.1 OmpA family protein [Saprospiraceae bacterium]
MTVRNLLLSILLMVAAKGLMAQDAAAPAGGGTYRSFTPADQWEVGLNAGLPFVSGDLDSKLGFGGGLHVRKAFDHVFSLRAGALYARTKNELATAQSSSEMSWFSGSLQVVAALNNIRFNKPYRKVLLNAYAGIGATSFTTDYKNILQVDGSRNGEFKSGLSPYAETGLGLAFRVSPKFNIGIEYGIAFVLGGNGDLLDGNENVDARSTTYRDYLHYPNLRLNFNLGGKDKSGAMRSEPLYWANPLAQVSEAIAALEARPVFDLTDTDGDGVIDMIDQEKESPAGARVDTRGVTLDSDGDKVPDYKDKEPFSPPGYKVNADGVAQVPPGLTEADVNRIVDAKLANFKLPTQEGLADWFLPVINFANDSYAISYSEYTKLYQVAQVMKNNPKIRVTVTGHTDQTGSDTYNNVLSYNRAKAAIEFLVNQHGIARDRLVLDWAGKSSALVPARSSQINRRVEFRVAKPGETDKPRPEGPAAGKGRFMGNKATGY